QPVNFDPSLHQRLRVNHLEKKRIGKKAIDYIKDGYSIVIDSGSTAQEIAKNFKQFNNLKLITNSLSIADICADNSGVEVIMLGGELRREMRSLIGPIAENTLQNFHVDLAFIGADSISVEGGIYTPVVAEATLSRIMIQIAQKVIVVLDSSKFDQKSLVKISDLKPVDVIITDKNIPKEALKKLNKMSIELALV
ncbi:MAG TPA: DeoR/GlpR transcriptional regulator, partial [Saprospiraceae bacterium]|nr:DeoR/GlpR transcriptional regulator [Saprospiraceae bacterium]